MPDTSTEVAIATTTLTTSAASIDFSSIPATYTDLRLVIFTETGGTGALFKLNNVSTGGLYSQTAMRGNGSDVTGANTIGANVMYIGGYSVSLGTAPIFTTTTINFFSYAGSTFKTLLQNLSADQNGSGITSAVVGIFASTSAINQITLYSATFGAGTTATLYGIL